MFTRSNGKPLLGTLAVLAASATLFAAAPASAQMQSTQSKAVHFDDLNLSADDGAAALHDRIRRAVRSVCRVDQAQGLKEMSDARACSRTAMADAMPRVQLAVASARTNQGYAANTIDVRTGR